MITSRGQRLLLHLLIQCKLISNGWLSLADFLSFFFCKIISRSILLVYSYIKKTQINKTEEILLTKFFFLEFIFESIITPFINSKGLFTPSMAIYLIKKTRRVLLSNNTNYKDGYKSHFIQKLPSILFN